MPASSAVPDQLAVLEQETARLHDALARCDPADPVPTCPAWTAADLLDHVADVHRFFAAVLDDDPRTDEAVDALDAAREPLAGPWSEQLASAADRGERLRRRLRAHPADEPRWMWTADPGLHTVGYLRRRMAHEALVHRVDAELTAGRTISSVPIEVAIDGLDEVLRVFFGGPPAWTAVVDSGGLVRVRAVDAERSWWVRPITVRGHRPCTDHEITGSALSVHDGPVDERAVVATVTGRALDLDLWWWSRPASVSTDGDRATLAWVERVRGEGID